MKFELINEGMLKCSLTRRELNDNGVDLEDFFANSQNARDFLEKVMRQAENEVGFSRSGNMMSVQAAVLSDNDIVLTFCDHQITPADIMNQLKSLFSAGEKTPELRTPEKDPFIALGEQSVHDYLLTFSSMDRMIRFARVLGEHAGKGDHVISTAYRYRDRYYIHANLNFCTKQYIYHFVSAGMEYASAMQRQDAFVNHLAEHGTKLSDPWAMEMLALL